MKFRSARDVCLLLPLCLSLTGCSVGPLAKQTAAFAKATDSFTVDADKTYARAEDIHESTEFDRVLSGEIPANFNPENITPLFHTEDMAARTKALGALKAYAEKLNDIALNTEKKNLQSASKAAGSGTATVATDVGVTTPKNAGAIISTAVYAIGDFLETRIILKSLPKEIQKVDPAIQSLCKVFEDDADVMQHDTSDALEQRIEKLTAALVKNQSSLDFDQRRARVQEIETAVSDKKQLASITSKFKKSAVELALTHSALAAVATNNDSQGLQKKIQDLREAVQDLSDYYKFASAK